LQPTTSSTMCETEDGGSGVAAFFFIAGAVYALPAPLS
jgi:hypothetical protein